MAKNEVRDRTEFTIEHHDATYDILALRRYDRVNTKCRVFVSGEDDPAVPMPSTSEFPELNLDSIFTVKGEHPEVGRYNDQPIGKEFPAGETRDSQEYIEATGDLSRVA